MAGKEVVKDIQVKASTIKDGKIHPTRVYLTSSINSVAQGSVSYIHKSSDANKSASDMTAKEVFATMGQRQTDSFRDIPSRPGATISAAITGGGSINFKGSCSAPEYTFSASEVELVEHIQPSYASLNSFDLSCYPLFADWDKILKSPPTDLAQFIWQIIKNILKEGRSNIDNIRDDTSKAQAKKQDEINKTVQQFVEKLFKNSQDKMGWNDAIQKLKESGKTEQIRERIINAVLSSSGGFLNNIIHLAEEFQCVYVPDFEDVGYLVNKKELFKSSETKLIHPISLSARVGSVGMFPVRAVAVASTSVVQDDDLMRANLNYTIFPEDIESRPGGTILQVQGPMWLPPGGYDDAELKEVETGSSAPSKKTLPKKSAKTAEKVTASRKKTTKMVSKLLSQWAKNAYYWEAAGQAFALVSIELDFTFKVGTRYKIKGDSGELFSGILNSIEHNIRATSDGNGSGTTSLEFSHVLMNGAKIPNID